MSGKNELVSKELEEIKSYMGMVVVDSSNNEDLAALVDEKTTLETAQRIDYLGLGKYMLTCMGMNDVMLSPLHVAAYAGNESACLVLLEKEGNVVHAVERGGRTALHYATASGKMDVIKRLRSHHADVQFKSCVGVSSVDMAAAEEVKEALVGPRFGGDEVEDEFLQDRLPAMVKKIEQAKNSENWEAMVDLLHCLRAEITTATSSLTSVPKPLKILTGSFSTMKELHASMPADAPKCAVAARVVLSVVLSMLSMSKTDGDKERDCIRFHLDCREACGPSGSFRGSPTLFFKVDPLESMGDPYVRHICLQFPEEYQKLDPAAEVSCVPRHTLLLGLFSELVDYLLKRNAEPEVVDLLMEIEEVRDLKPDLRKMEAGDRSMSEVLYSHLRTVVAEKKAQVTVNNRICQYLVSCVKYVQEPLNSRLLETAFDLHMKYGSYPQALLVAMQLNDMALVQHVFGQCDGDRAMRRQLGFMLGRQQVFLDLDGPMDDTDGGEEVREIIFNGLLNSNFLALARELDIVEPKDPEHIYKTHLENSRFSSANSVDSAKQNLASSFVNGLVNCAFGKDNIMTEDGNKWIYKHKPAGMLSATASLGLILLWDVDAGLTEIDKFLYASDDNIKAGALLACGVVNTGVRNECDPALALLSDYVQNKSAVIRSGAILGLGLSYAGSNRLEVLEVLTPCLTEGEPSDEIIGLAAMSCGLVAIGSCSEDLSTTLVQIMEEAPEAMVGSTYMRMVALGLALLYLGKQDKVDVVMEALRVVSEPLSSIARILVDICAYAGTGDVLKVQSLLHICSEHFADKEASSTEGNSSSSPSSSSTEEDAKKKDQPKPEPGSLREPGAHQAFAVLGLALISQGEGIGAEMALRMCNHCLQYGEPPIRRAVPLALALISVSNPNLSIMDTLSKFSHDSDPEVAYNSIFAMGVIGAGTNNARLAGLLRQLAQFYCKDANSLFMVRLAQGLIHLGKGTLTLNPYHSDRQLMTPVAIGGLLAVMVTLLDCKNLVLSGSPHLLFYLVPAIQPRMLVTFDEDMKPLSVNVRVGQAVDTVAQAGQQKGITGFQTHCTPVLLAYGERAELATEEYIPLSPVLEGFVILRKNPDFKED